MVIHDVEMNDIRTGGNDPPHFLAEPREIG
jgi:hypothetical protein